MQIFAIVVSLAIAVVGIALFVRAIRSIIGVMKVGQPTSRTDNPGMRTVTMLKESLLHTRMLQWHWVGAGHWFIFIGFGLLFFTLVTAFGQLFHAEFALPLIGHFFLWEWLTESVTFVMIAAIMAFIVYRVTRPSERVRGPRGRFFGSTMWQAYFVELVILGVGLCIVTLRGLEYALESDATAFHYPLTFWLGEAFSGMSDDSLKNGIYLMSMLKILISFIWMITISLNLTMGVAWHRFLAFFNIWFKRESSGRTALGAVKPLTSDGKTVTLDDIDDLDEDSVLGVGSIEDFSWKGILDFSSCTECGRCQSQCPAWNTDKPLSPKLLITALRDHAYAKAPYLQAAEGEREALLEGNDTLTKEVERPLVGDTGDGWFYNPEDGSAVIDPDVLWSCTGCGACVQQCPVDIEHVDHIVDMRRYAVLVESNFPAELNGLFKGLENKGNPWNMSPTARMDWAKGLDFEVKVVGDSIESLDEVEWLFWVGCAGAYEDRAKKTTRAVAELLDMAGVSFGVLGNGETCTGDPARRAGNEFVFQGLAQQNVETFKEYKVKKVVSTCAHCFNTLKNEYKEFGVELEVVHHTQLLNRLVREGKLTPVTDGAGAAKRSITYHDPCFIGRHNGVYTPPRELLQVLPGAEVVEMPRNSEKSFCCGAGGARMWMEENLGERINVNRTVEAVETGADQIAVGCPFCRVMLSDGLTAQQAKGEAREEVEVLDVAQMLLASVKGEVATKVKPGGAAKAAPKAAPAEAAEAKDEATRAEPEAGDATQTTETVTDTEDVGPAAKASGGTSLFDTPADADPEPEPEPVAAEEKPSTGGSLFDVEAPAEQEKPEATPEAKTEPEPTPVEPVETKPAADAEPDLGAGGSLFDVEAPAEQEKPEPTPDAEAEAEPEATPDAKAEPEPEPEPTPDEPVEKAETPAAAEPTAEIPDSGSLFDIEAPEPAPAAEKPAAKAEPEPEEKTEPEPGATPEAKSEPEPEPEPTPDEPVETKTEDKAETPAAAEPTAEIPEGGSLFDIEAPEPAPAEKPAAKAAPEAEEKPEPEPEPAPEAKTEPEPTPVETETEDEEPAPAGNESEDLSPGAAISAAATAAANTATEEETSEAAAPAEEAPEPEPADESADESPDASAEPDEPDEPDEDEKKPEAKPKPASSGEAHQPKTDVEIEESGSLFDL
ncbi:MAG TPA: heterodisulfide reductase-related iron-sulfur binding cluster [Nocardioides sp.]|nr:heterodisulfide reductase-related iron-sulfur binding cluster [Nocardioides sp.]